MIPRCVKQPQIPRFRLTIFQLENLGSSVVPTFNRPSKSLPICKHPTQPCMFSYCLMHASSSCLSRKQVRKPSFPASKLTRLLFRGKDSSNCYSLSLSSSFPSSSRFMQFLLFANSLSLQFSFYALKNSRVSELA